MEYFYEWNNYGCTVLFIEGICKPNFNWCRILEMFIIFQVWDIVYSVLWLNLNSGLPVSNVCLILGEDVIVNIDHITQNEHFM